VVKAAMLEAVAQAPLALSSPAPDVLLMDFAGSAITYRARFWIDDFAADEVSRDEVRTAIFYAFQRHDIEIPYPIQVQYEKSFETPDAATRLSEQERLLEGVDLLASLPAGARRQIAVSAPMAVYGSGETLVRQGDEGQSMFVVLDGEVRVVLEPRRNEVARIRRGGYFGEMSLLTGDPRSATVLAAGDVTVVEIGVDLFRRIIAAHPEAIEKIGLAVMMRRAELDQIKSAASETATIETGTLVTRMKRFLRLV
jgi:CRP-like cAMP-binding protein